MSKKEISSQLEDSLFESGYSIVVGIDEVGRGPWAGPVCIGAFILRGKSYNKVEWVNDSKKLTYIKRLEIKNKFDELKSEYIVLSRSESEIDSFGISKCIEQMIFEIIERFKAENVFFLIDGRFSTNFGKNALQIIQGDSKHYVIAAASVVAKVYRDKLMFELSKKYDKWMFDKNKGYGTKEHFELIKKFGISPIHRQSYAPIKNFKINSRESC